MRAAHHENSSRVHSIGRTSMCSDLVRRRRHYYLVVEFFEVDLQLEGIAPAGKMLSSVNALQGVMLLRTDGRV